MLIPTQGYRQELLREAAKVRLIRYVTCCNSSTLVQRIGHGLSALGARLAAYRQAEQHLTLTPPTVCCSN
ncbi:MAG: hypothetical protein U0670_22750 [Anaerolineae bacterium]